MPKLHADNGGRNRRGFMALIAVVLLATGTLAFSLATVSAASTYADMAYRRELRIQAQLNADACLETISLMAAKDYFLNGVVRLSEFGCEAEVTNDSHGNYHIDATTRLSNVSWQEYRDIYLQWI